MLNATKLSAELHAFHDSRSPTFVGFPTTRDQARDRWASAFDTYVGDLVCLDPLLTPGNGANLLGVKAAFRAPLSLAQSIGAPAKAAEFAAAWQAAMLSILLLGSPAAYGVAPVASILWFPPPDLIARHAALVAELTRLFETPAVTIGLRLDNIANAFHTATVAMSAQASLPAGVVQLLTYG
tara:strand:+ start:21968 stop:22513 length:546 start_codon:yes stop_codon:yes gene_type:complete